MRVLTGPQAIKQVKEISLALDNEEGDLLFQPDVGGSICLFPESTEDDVLRFLSFFEFHSAHDIINSPCVVEDLQKRRDLFSQPPPLLFLKELKKYLSETTPTLELYRLIDLYSREVVAPKKTTFEILDQLLGKEDKIKILNEQDFSHIVSLLPFIKPRQYSTILEGASLKFAVSSHYFAV